MRYGQADSSKRRERETETERETERERERERAREGDREGERERAQYRYGDIGVELNKESDKGLPFRIGLENHVVGRARRGLHLDGDGLT